MISYQYFLAWLEFPIPFHDTVGEFIQMHISRSILSQLLYLVSEMKVLLVIKVLQPQTWIVVPSILVPL